MRVARALEINIKVQLLLECVLDPERFFTLRLLGMVHRPPAPRSSSGSSFALGICDNVDPQFRSCLFSICEVAKVYWVFISVMPPSKPTDRYGRNRAWEGTQEAYRPNLIFRNGNIGLLNKLWAKSRCGRNQRCPILGPASEPADLV